MLGQLHIENIGIIEDITINFEDGLNIMTGETGSGKSLIIASIAAVTGSRISKDMLKTGADSALIEAYFFEKENDIILSREIFANGRNICKIDGKMVTLAQLKEVGEALLDIHGQHDNQSLLNPHMHIELLDKFAGESIFSIKMQYQEKLKKYRELEQQLENNFGDEKERSRKIDLLQYQVNEIRQANLKEGEEEELQTRRNFIMNAEKIVKSLSNTYYTLNDIVIDNLGMGVHELSTIADLDERYDKILLNLNEAFYMLKDSASETLDAMNRVEFNENEQNEIEERLDVIFALKRKYGQDIESILQYEENTSKELYQLQNSDEIMQEIQKQIIQLKKELQQLAIQMQKIRKENAHRICQKVNQELQELEMLHAKLQFDFQETEKYQENGIDDIQMMIVTNLGEEPKQLSKIASGGEISRIMLALKTVFASVDSIPCMIFDEIDVGISGQAAKVVAQKMKEISKNHQLICVTHLPVIAATGEHNYLITKEAKQGKTNTKITKLTEKEIVQEIARMLDGNNITEISIKHANELRKNR